MTSTADKSRDEPQVSEPLVPTLEELVEQGAARFDPVRFVYIQAMVKKAGQQQPAVGRKLEEKARLALSSYRNEFLAARERASVLLVQARSERSESAEALERLFEAGDFAALKRLATRSDKGAGRGLKELASLNRTTAKRGGTGDPVARPSFEDEMRRQELEVLQTLIGVSEGAGAKPDPAGNGPGELSVMRSFRQSRARRNSERQLNRVIQDGPKNPGPLNSQALIIRSLKLMRELSPGYAGRFMDYMDSLLWLERAGTAVVTEKTKGGGRRKS